MIGGDEMSAKNFQGTWQLNINFVDLTSIMQKKARSAGCSKNDDVLFLMDGKTGQNKILAKGTTGDTLKISCAKCGNLKVDLDMDKYEFVFGKNITSNEDIMYKKNYQIRMHSLLLCTRCIFKEQLKKLRISFVLLIVSVILFFIINEASESDSGALIFLLLVTVPASIYYLVIAFNKKSNGNSVAMKIFNEQYPGGFLSSDELWSIKVYNKKVRSGELKEPVDQKLPIEVSFQMKFKDLTANLQKEALAQGYSKKDAISIKLDGKKGKMTIIQKSK